MSDAHSTVDKFTTGPIPPEADNMQELIDAKFKEITRWLESRGIAEGESPIVLIAPGNRIQCIIQRAAKTEDV